MIWSLNEVPSLSTNEIVLGFLVLGSFLMKTASLFLFFSPEALKGEDGVLDCLFVSPEALKGEDGALGCVMESTKEHYE